MGQAGDWKRPFLRKITRKPVNAVAIASWVEMAWVPNRSIRTKPIPRLPRVDPMMLAR